MLGYKRTDRVGDQIRLEVADILTRRMKDPRVGFVTVTSVDLSADLRQAWVYVTVLQEGEQGNEAMATLARATGFIRGELGRRLKLRYVPELTFMRDRSVDQVRHVMSLLDNLPELGEQESVQADSRAGGCDGEKESVTAGKGPVSAGPGTGRVEYDSRPREERARQGQRSLSGQTPGLGGCNGELGGGVGGNDGCDGEKESDLADENIPSDTVGGNQDRTPDNASSAGICNSEGAHSKGQGR